MAWSTATLRLASPRCDAVTNLEDGQRLRCMSPGAEGTLAHLSGGELDEWADVRPCRQGRLVQRVDSCQECPARMLPQDMVPVQVEASKESLTMQVAFPRPNSLADAYHTLRQSGQGPRITRHRGAEAPAPLGLVDLGVLTPRQREALESARRIRYFEEGNDVGVDALAGAMGCSRSTAHEHLRRGLSRLLDAVLG